MGEGFKLEYIMKLNNNYKFNLKSKFSVVYLMIT